MKTIPPHIVCFVCELPIRGSQERSAARKSLLGYDGGQIALRHDRCPPVRPVRELA